MHFLIGAPEGIEHFVERHELGLFSQDEYRDAFRDAGFSSEPRPDVPRWKYAKLLLTLANAVDALCPPDDDAGRLIQLARAEGEAPGETPQDYVPSLHETR